MKTNSYAYAAALAVFLAAAPLASANDDKPAAGTTVTGCVSASNDGKSFTLTESSADMQATPKTWTLVASGGVDLSKYANHKVEVTGSSDKTDLGATSPTASTAAGATGSSGKQFKVKSVKDISNTCS